MLSISCHNNSRHSYTAWLSNDGACTMNTKQDGQYWLQLQLCVHALPSCCAGDSQYYIYCLFYRHLVLYVTCCMLQEDTVFQTGRQTGDRRHPSTSESLVFTLDRHLCLHVLLHPLSLMPPPPPPTLSPCRPTSMCFSTTARLTNTWQHTQSGHTGIGHDRIHQ